MRGFREVYHRKEDRDKIKDKNCKDDSTEDKDNKEDYREIEQKEDFRKPVRKRIMPRIRRK